MTSLLVASCFLMAVLFVVIASWMQAQGFRRAAAANLAAAALCGVGALSVPFHVELVPVVALVGASLLGATSMHAVNVGRG